MEPIQLQCGNCGQVMGISPEHMGAQVQCPHCKTVVQTPAPAAPAAAPPAAPAPAGEFSAPAGPAFHGGEHESIFSQPEPTDDLFGAGTPPRVEMPLDYAPRPSAAAAAAPAGTAEHAPPVHEQPSHTSPSPFAEAASGSAQEELAAFTPRRVDDRSMLGPILLIFLVPYALFTTAYIGYLLYIWPKDNPLKNLPDIGPKGQPRYQVKHDLPLDKGMKTALGQAISIGAIEVTPLKVKHTPEGDLVLVFRAKNISRDQIFTPISDDYLRFSEKSLDSGRPYTFLERISRDNLKKIYGGYLEWFKGPPGQEKASHGEIEIAPGQEAIVHLISADKYRKIEVPNVVKAREPMVWRLQVRQGLVPVEGKMVSATTVIGVEFTSRDIVKEKDRDEG